MGKKTPLKKTEKKSLPGKQAWLGILLVLAATWLIYQPSLKNKLTNWDDQEYITYNKDMADASFKKHFVEKPHVMGNFHPLTMLTLAWNYQSAFDPVTGETDPLPFHRTNMWLHIFNALLVYLFLYFLSGNNLVATLTAAAFALHPMHVESVAWAAERKDVLYSLFYLGALVSWVYFRKQGKDLVAWVLTATLFLGGLFSKAVTVTLPLALLLCDWYMGRRDYKKMFLEKIPLFVLSVYFGLRAIEAQKEFEAIQGNDMYHLGERILFACYGVMMYVAKFFAPVNLSCFYSFPVKGEMGPLYYLAPVVVAGLTFLVFKYRGNRDLVFGGGFFLITAILVLQLLPVGGAVMADRYSYLPHIGLGFAIFSLLVTWRDKKMPGNKVPVVLACFFLALLTWLTGERIKIWKDSITLWTDAEKKDQRSPKIYNNFGDAYNLEKNYDQGIFYLNKAIALKPDYPDAYYNRGLAHYYQGKLNEAIEDYSTAIKLNPNLKQAWHNRAGTWFTAGNYEAALSDALKAQELGYPVDPEFIRVLKEEVAKKKAGL
jgi:protein O-mannosyl-transferase